MKLDRIKYIFCDFDGVLTDNKVYLNENGLESVVLNRSDGLAIDILKKNHIKVFVISTESNKVVAERCKKLNVNCFQNLNNKKKFIEDFLIKKKIDIVECIYIGNDLNDYSAMQIFQNSFCPMDSHIIIRNLAKKTLNLKGGEGILMEIIENIDGIDLGINL